MSGPKVDTATLRRQQQERLEEARRKRQKLAADITRTIGTFSESCDEMCGLFDMDSSVSGESGNVRKQQELYIKRLNKLMNKVQKGNELFDVKSAEDELQEIRRDIGTDKEFQRSRIVVENNEILMKRKQETEAVRNTRHRIISSLASSAPEPEAGITEAEISQQAEAFEEEIQLQMKETEMTGTHKNSILLISQDLHELLESSLPAETKSKRIRRLYAQYEKVGSLIRSEMEVMRAAYEEYCAECFDSGSAPAALADFSTVNDIRKATGEARENAENKLSQEYIRRQIDDVMAKHGYNIIRSDLLEETSGQVLYGVDEDSAINVFVSGDNQVTMRVVGVGFDSDISDAESEKLYQQQCAFCSLHPQITAELEMRGVILTTRKHNPPDKKFNKKIKVRTRKNERQSDRNARTQQRQELRTMYKEID